MGAWFRMILDIFSQLMITIKWKLYQWSQKHISIHQILFSWCCWHGLLSSNYIMEGKALSKSQKMHTVQFNHAILLIHFSHHIVLAAVCTSATQHNLHWLMIERWLVMTYIWAGAAASRYLLMPPRCQQNT